MPFRSFPNSFFYTCIFAETDTATLPISLVVFFFCLIWKYFARERFELKSSVNYARPLFLILAVGNTLWKAQIPIFVYPPTRFLWLIVDIPRYSLNDRYFGIYRFPRKVSGISKTRRSSFTIYIYSRALSFPRILPDNFRTPFLGFNHTNLLLYVSSCLFFLNFFSHL